MARTWGCLIHQPQVASRRFLAVVEFVSTPSDCRFSAIAHRVFRASILSYQTRAEFTLTRCRRLQSVLSDFVGEVQMSHTTSPNHLLQRTRPSRRGCNRGVPWAGSLSLGC